VRVYDSAVFPSFSKEGLGEVIYKSLIQNPPKLGGFLKIC
jgi:hypothetical protein